MHGRDKREEQLWSNGEEGLRSEPDEEAHKTDGILSETSTKCNLSIAWTPPSLNALNLRLHKGWWG